jgi:hypothetical protein
MMTDETRLPGFLCHYFEAASGPFRSLSDLPIPEAEAVQEQIRKDSNRFASRRSADYLSIRRGLEDQIRQLFIAKGGEPVRTTPHYMILGDCPWLQTWYVEGCEIRIALECFNPSAVSFTYGDSFPAMRFNDGRPYRGQVYTIHELPELVCCHGLPQIWNSDGKLGPERYIEAQVWEDEPVLKALKSR